ncbi:MAG TPA: FtsX-like permease family protein, partial [Blastocatellia bacterium]|nr:FtsX-like permease family protein [Blastocatellia bacterium]
TGFGAGQPWAYRSLLMVVQVALSIVLLVGSGLMARSFQRLRSAGLGFNPNGVVTFWVNLPEAGYRTDAAKRDFYRRALERITAAPGVESVCVSSFLAFGPYITTSFNLEGQPLVPPREDQQAAYKVIGFGYFKTLSIPLLAGREFSRDDRTGTRPVAIVSKAFADKYFPGQSPVGKRIHTDWEGEPAWREIVGVAANVMDCGSLFDSSPEFYGPIMQASPPGSLAFLVKSGRDPKSMERSLRSLILSVDKDQPISHVQTMDESHSEMLAEPRFETELASSFSILALVLAGVGLYGLVSYSVTERTQEVGIRMALGASRHHLLALLMGRGMVAVFAGIAVGLAASIALTRFISSLLNGVSPTDAVTFIAVPLLLAGVTMAASYLPARRAIKLDPVHVLRYE